MRRNSLILAALTALAFASSPALGQDGGGRLTGLKLSGDEPIQIESDRLEVREAENVAVFIGNVTVVQGDTLLKAGRMTVHYAKGSGGESRTVSTNPLGGGSEIERIEVDGKVYVKSKEQVATGDAGTFDMGTEVLTLTGKEVVLTEGPNVVTGCTLTVQMQTGLAKLDGCGGRVRSLLTPNSQSN